MSGQSKDFLDQELENWSKEFSQLSGRQKASMVLAGGAAFGGWWMWNHFHAWLPLLHRLLITLLHVAVMAGVVALIVVVLLAAVRSFWTWRTWRDRVSVAPLARPGFDPTEAQMAAFTIQVHGLRRRWFAWIDAPASGFRVLMRTSKDGRPLYLWQFPRRYLRSLRSAVEACFPGDQIKLEEDLASLLPEAKDVPKSRLELEPGRRDEWPFRRIPTGLDPKSRFARAIANSSEEVETIIAIDHRPMPPQHWGRWLRRTLSRAKKEEKGEGLLRDRDRNVAAERVENKREQAAIWRKIDEKGNRTPLFYVQVLVEARGRDRQARRIAIQDLRGGFDQWQSENFFASVGVHTGGSDALWRSMYFDRRMRRGTSHSDRAMAGWEVAGWLTPWNVHCTCEDVVRLEPEEAQPPEAAVTTGGVGVTTLPDGEDGAKRRVVLTPQNARYHTHVMAPIGAGKSTWLGNAALDWADLKMDGLGLPMVLIDPNKGDTTRYFLDRLPERHWDRVVVMDPALTVDPATKDRYDRWVGFDLLGERDAQAHGRIAGQIATIFDRIYGKDWGQKGAYFMKLVVQTLLKVEDSTLDDAVTLLTDETVRDRMLAGIDDPALKVAWSTYKPEEAASLIWKLNDVLLLQPAVRNIVCQRDSKVDLAKLLNGDGILLVTLKTGVIGEDAASLIGALLVTRLWQVIQRRASIPEDNRRFLLAALDEFPKMIQDPTTWDEWTAEGRGYRAGLMLVNQHYDQLARANVNKALDHDVRNKFVFQLEPDDAGPMAARMRPLTAPDITHLPSHHLAARLCIDGHVEPAYVGPVEGPRQPHGRGDEVMAASLARYGKVQGEAEPQREPVLSGEPNGHPKPKLPKGPPDWGRRLGR